MRDLAADFSEFPPWFPHGLAILAFPSREFGAQEYECDNDIQNFAKKQGFPGILMSLTEVLPNAPNQCATYRFLHDNIPDFKINWNFGGKFIIGPGGTPRATTDPRRDIKQLLEEQPPPQCRKGATL